jgi:hypothetical protein
MPSERLQNSGYRSRGQPYRLSQVVQRRDRTNSTPAMRNPPQPRQVG